MGKDGEQTHAQETQRLPGALMVEYRAEVINLNTYKPAALLSTGMFLTERQLFKYRFIALVSGQNIEPRN